MLVEEEFLKNQKDCVLNNFKLINPEEIVGFIRSNNGLLELLEKVFPLLVSYFPNYSYSLSYAQDPEIKRFEDLILCIHGDEKEFMHNRKKLSYLENDIESLKVSNCKVKRLLLVDVLL